jgi:hypothetical protein
MTTEKYILKLIEASIGDIEIIGGKMPHWAKCFSTSTNPAFIFRMVLY